MLLVLSQNSFKLSLKKLIFLAYEIWFIKLKCFLDFSKLKRFSDFINEKKINYFNLK